MGKFVAFPRLDRLDLTGFAELRTVSGKLAGELPLKRRLEARGDEEPVCAALLRRVDKVLPTVADTYSAGIAGLELLRDSSIKIDV